MLSKKTSQQKNRLKIVFTLIWTALTLALVIWWWVWAWNLSDLLSPSAHRMIKYEGTTLLTVICIGSYLLIRFVISDHKKNERLQLFFSVFTHDIKTSISRLRLQTEVLIEDSQNQTQSQTQNQTQFLRLKKEMARLDLQLENSLLLTSQEHQIPLIETVKLSQLISLVKEDFQNLHIELSQDVHLTTDKKWMICVLKNIFQNSVNHGKADQIKIDVAQLENNHLNPKIVLNITDNGSGLNSDQIKLLKLMGNKILHSGFNHSNGIGLFLTKSLLSKINSTILFENMNPGFNVQITAKGCL